MNDFIETKDRIKLSEKQVYILKKWNIGVKEISNMTYKQCSETISRILDDFDWDDYELNEYVPINN